MILLYEVYVARIVQTELYVIRNIYLVDCNKLILIVICMVIVHCVVNNKS